MEGAQLIQNSNHHPLLPPPPKKKTQLRAFQLKNIMSWQQQQTKAKTNLLSIKNRSGRGGGGERKHDLRICMNKGKPLGF